MKTVICSDNDGVRTLTIDRPELRNAIDSATSREIMRCLDDAAADPELRVVVLTGAKGSFCSGMDLRAFAGGERPSLPGRGLAGLTRNPPNIAVVAAVEGPAIGGGFEIALACDLLVAAESATFALPEIRLGLVPSQGGIVRLPRRLPHGIAAEMLLTGRRYTATQLAPYGIFARVVPDGHALNEALQIACHIADQAPLSTQAIVTALRSHCEPDEAQWRSLDQLCDPVLSSEDAREGASAFLSHRQPCWKGK